MPINEENEICCIIYEPVYKQSYQIKIGDID